MLLWLEKIGSFAPGIPSILTNEIVPKPREQKEWGNQVVESVELFSIMMMKLYLRKVFPSLWGSAPLIHPPVYIWKPCACIEALGTYSSRDFKSPLL